MNGLISVGLSGMGASMQRLDAAAGRIARVSGTADTPPSLAADLVTQRQAAAEFKANVQTVKTADQVLGTLLDVFA